MRLTGLLLAVFFLSPVQAFSQNPILLKVALSAESPPTSYQTEGEPRGLLVDLYVLLFSAMPGYSPELRAYPWARAQDNLQNGTSDVFCTFPSETRKKYAVFSSAPLYVWDYGCLVYDLENPKRKQIESAKSFNDLKDLTFIAQESVEWEKENVPPFIKRYFVVNGPTLLHMAFSRKAGDFFIMGPEQAVYYSRELGYLKQLGIKKVDFIPNSKIEFHVGIRKTFPGWREFITELDKVMKDPDFLKKKSAVIARFTRTH
ncbi:MAG: transporter substrate-binding domain-containing protein [Spirochaetia bacterium]|nr:transporter substrate-binding domain-containing protein [Spirochaetia bacterium]